MWQEFWTVRSRRHPHRRCIHQRTYGASKDHGVRDDPVVPGREVMARRSPRQASVPTSAPCFLRDMPSLWLPAAHHRTSTAPHKAPIYKSQRCLFLGDRNVLGWRSCLIPLAALCSAQPQFVWSVQHPGGMIASASRQRMVKRHGTAWEIMDWMAMRHIL